METTSEEGRFIESVGAAKIETSDLGNLTIEVVFAFNPSDPDKSTATFIFDTDKDFAGFAKQLSDQIGKELESEQVSPSENLSISTKAKPLQITAKGKAAACVIYATERMNIRDLKAIREGRGPRTTRNLLEHAIFDAYRKTGLGSMPQRNACMPGD